MTESISLTERLYDMDEREVIKKLEAEGYEDVEAVAFEPNFIIGDHTHDFSTVHIITAGTLIIINNDRAKHFIEGKRVQFPAGTKHSAMAGPEGLTFVMGVKKEN